MNEGYKGNSIRTSKYNIITFLPFFLYFMFSRVAYLYFLTQVGKNFPFPCFYLTGLLVRQIYCQCAVHQSAKPGKCSAESMAGNVQHQHMRVLAPSAQLRRKCSQLCRML